jgi:acetyltransferase
MVEKTAVPHAAPTPPREGPRGRYVIRRLASSEGEACDAFFDRLHRHDVRWRFGGPRSSGDCLLPDRVATRPSLAFAAARPSGEILGVLNIEYLDPATAEIALIVRSDLKRRGIGSALLSHTMRWSKAAGLRRLVGHVMAENKVMLRLAIAAGFRCAGGDQVLVELSWVAEAAP